MLKYWLLMLCTAASALYPLNSAFGAEEDDDFSDRYMALRYDFFFSLKADELPQFMKYHGSRMDPITRVAISYSYMPRNQPENATKNQPYEHLYYLEQAPVGCRRVAPLNIPPGTKGAIMVLPGNNLAAGAEADAIIRLLVDSALLRSLCDVVIVPKDAFGAIFSAFSSFGFYEVNVPLETAYPGTISFTLISNPSGLHRELVFVDKRNF